MPVDQRMDIGLAQDLELIRALAGRLGQDANVVCWDEFAATLDDLSPMQARQLRDQLRLEISKGDKSMSAQTNTGIAPQTKVIEVPNVEAYSTNFYVDIESEGQLFSAQMTIRGGANGLDHIHRVLGAMKAVVQNGGAAKARGLGKSESAPVARNGHSGEPWEISSKKGRMVVQINWGAPPNQIECPLHHKPMKYGDNERGESYFHKHNEEWCRAGVERA